MTVCYLGKLPIHYSKATLQIVNSVDILAIQNVSSSQGHSVISQLLLSNGL